MVLIFILSMKESRTVQNIHVQAQKDHIASLCTASPIQALTELIWNALDADAFDVKIDIIQNPLGGIDSIRVCDDGTGINALEAERYFGNLGGSWKRAADMTPLARRVLHGSKGKGRFKAFALGNRVEWRTTLEADKHLRSFTLAGNAVEPDVFTLTDIPSPGPATGTEVMITDIHNTLGSLLETAWVVQQLASHFALYLKAYPNVRIYFQGLLVNPVIVQHASHTYHLKSSEGSKAELQVIEWKTKQNRGKIVFCNTDGFALHEVDAAIRPGSGFNYTAYLVSSRFAELHAENLLILDEMHPEIKAFLDASRDILRRHFRERREAITADLLNQWQADKVYPFDGEATSDAETALRKRFNACALAVRAASDNFDILSVLEKRLLFRLLRETIEAKPDHAAALLSELLELPQKKRRDLQKA